MRCGSRWAGAAFLLLACGSDPGSAPPASTSTTATGDSTSPAVDSSDVESTAASTSGLDDTGTTPLGCEMHTAGCPSGCAKATVYPGTWDDVRVGAGRDLCVAAGSELAIDYRSTWWSEVDGELLFVRSAQDCPPPFPPLREPIEWRECTGAGDEPAPCHYLCAQDVCPGETDAEVLGSCDVESPCPGAALDCGGPGAECLLSAFRDRTPGRYAFSLEYPNVRVDHILVIAADSSVRATYDEVLGIVCAVGIWQPARVCRLADPQVFADCLAADGCESCYPDPYALDGWLLDCVDEPAACP